MTDQPLPPCGCKNGCQHQEYPGFAAQRTCRFGHHPTSAPGAAEDQPAPSLNESLDAALAVVGPGLAALGTVLQAIAVAAVPALADLRRALEAIEEHEHRPGQPHGPARDQFRRQGRG
jgi:hypothetical protein